MRMRTCHPDIKGYAPSILRDMSPMMMSSTVFKGGSRGFGLGSLSNEFSLVCSTLLCSGYGWMAREGRQDQPDRNMLQHLHTAEYCTLDLNSVSELENSFHDYTS
ncbi:hypothetical protein Tco_1090608 [Tanacetum coccineum]|uniref:Uncharacterized protein n=1 Tax=Tanacetum coccineum TaxID=301880 RepID=A0ABQ5I4R9_9ASTR